MPNEKKEKEDVPMTTQSDEKKATQSRQDSAGTGSSSSSSSSSNGKTEDDKSTGKDSADPKTENLYTASVKKISAPITAAHNQDLIDFEKKHPHKKHRKEPSEEPSAAQETPF